MPAHSHNIVDMDRFFIIDPETRAISVPEGYRKTKLVQYDHDSERYAFEIPRYVEGHDMSVSTMIQIHYLNVSEDKLKKNVDVYQVSDISVVDEEFVNFSWLISRNATQLAGLLSWAISFTCVENDVEIYKWNTTIYPGVEIAESLSNGNIVVEQYSDLLNEWYSRLFGLGDTLEQRLVDASLEQQRAIERKGEETLADIPGDLTALQADINGVKEGLINKLDKFSIEITPSDIEILNGNISKDFTPVIGTNDSYKRLKCSAKEGDSFVISGRSQNSNIPLCVYVDSDGNTCGFHQSENWTVYKNLTVVAPKNTSCIFVNGTSGDLNIKRKIYDDISINDIVDVIGEYKLFNYDSSKDSNSKAISYSHNIGSICITPMVKNESYDGSLTAFTKNTSGNRITNYTISSNKNNVIELTEEISGLDIVITDGNIKKEFAEIRFLIGDVDKQNIYQKVFDFDERISNIEKIKTSLSGKNVSILGDSYSTMEGWLPNGYVAYYKKNGEALGIKEASQTWWYKYLQKVNANLLINSSFSGSRVTNGGDNSIPSFIKRAKTDMGENRVDKVKPNVIFVFGGTNDYWQNVPCGDVKYSDRSESDLETFAPAFAYLINYLKEFNFSSKIVNITNQILSDEYKNAISNVCEHYEIKNIVLYNLGLVDSSGLHPSINSMKKICDIIYSEIQ